MAADSEGQGVAKGRRDLAASLRNGISDTLDAVLAALAALARDRPVVVAVDDPCWADHISLKLIEHLVSVTGQAAVVFWGRADARSVDDRRSKAASGGLS